MNFWELNQPSSRVAVVMEGGASWTYGQLASAALRLHTYLPQSSEKQLGVVLCQNDTMSLMAYLTGLRRGDAICLLDAKMNPELLGRILEAYRPEWVVAPVGDVALEEGALRQGGVFDFWHFEKVSLVHDREQDAGQEHSFWLGVMRGSDSVRADAGAGGRPPCLIHPDLALLLSTSGTTGNPKMVRLSYRNLAANASSIAEYLSLTEHERPITTLPMNYSYGLSVLNSHLHAGATILLTERSVLERGFWDFFKKEEATSLAGVPYLYQMLRRTGLERMELPSLKTLTQAGGRLDPPTVQYYQNLATERGWNFYVMYGQTEATARMSYVPFERLAEKTGSIGIPIPRGEMQIDSSGELIYTGPNVMMGYAENRSDLFKGDELHGVLRTGDLAERDEDGYFRITGRLNRFLKVFGLRVNLDDVERQMAERLFVQAACTGQDDKLWVFVEVGQEERQEDRREQCAAVTAEIADRAELEAGITARVADRTEQEVGTMARVASGTEQGAKPSLLESVKQLLHTTYRLHHSAIRIESIPQLPRRANGKIDYQTLKEWVVS